MLKKILCFVLVITMALCLCSCGKKDGTTNTTSQPDTATNGSQKVLKSDKTLGFQLEQPKTGEEVAVLHTNYGDIYIRLFPEEAPKTVENFVGLIKNGYYNNLIFHRVIDGFCVQGGDPKGDGTGGESLWGSDFEDEFCDKLVNVTYSVAMANAGPGTNGSQFFINHSADKTIDRAQYDYDTQYNYFNNMYQEYQNYYADFTQQFPTVDDFIDSYAGGINPDSRLVPEDVWKFY